VVVLRFSSFCGSVIRHKEVKYNGHKVTKQLLLFSNPFVVELVSRHAVICLFTS